ncbi:MAG TPA: glutathionylspermidine synthase family protein [Fimbriimonadaceae bacterium]|nr:glutathionylspermidine synthase family protein [Fimbriimonadaceae bacterium]
MNRVPLTPRPDWKEKVESLGLLFHTNVDGTPYWNECAYYTFSAAEVEVLERASNDLWEKCLAAVEHVIQNDRFGELAIPVEAKPAIVHSWEGDVPSIYGRFDLAYNGIDPPKLLEFNADTPTSLLEAAAIQWHWLQDLYPQADQFNSIWEALVEKWRELKDGRHLQGAMLHFCHDANTEDLMTATVLRDSAEEAGLATKGLLITEVGWHSQNRWFVDKDDFRIQTAFKLYPWEWMLQDEFGKHAMEIHDQMQWIEPAWKMILSNKGILAILWELFPEHPNLLPAYIGRSRDLQEYVQKPLLSREGANVTIKRHGSIQRTSGDYGYEGVVYQQFFELPSFEGNRPVLGSWIVTDHGCCGLGIRESDGPVTDNLSRFVPHLFW